MSTQKHLRPHNRNADDPRLKVHLRLCDLDGETFRIVTLRPETDVCFSTNYFHDTWHILSDTQGAKALARLMWGLSYQKQPRTVVLIHGHHIKPTPFDAEPSDPILLLPSHLTPLQVGWLKHLKLRLKNFGAPTQTIRWQTFGLDAALQRLKEMSDEERRMLWCSRGYEVEPFEKQEKMRRCAGFVCFTAPPLIMRETANILYRLDPVSYGMDYHYLAEEKRKWHPYGEVQIFSDYRQRLNDAVVARREAADEIAENPLSSQARETVQSQCEQVRSRRKSSIRQSLKKLEPKTSEKAVN